MVFSRSRMALLSAVTAVALAGSLGMADRPASAATTPRLPETLASGAIVCSGDVCVQNDGYVGNTAYITEWAYDATFFGHFELFDIHGDVRNSATQTWYAGGRGDQFTIPARCGEQYTATAWSDIGGKEYFNGQVIFGGVCS